MHYPTGGAERLVPGLAGVLDRKPPKPRVRLSPDPLMRLKKVLGTPCFL